MKHHVILYLHDNDLENIEVTICAEVIFRANKSPTFSFAALKVTFPDILVCPHGSSASVRINCLEKFYAWKF